MISNATTNDEAKDVYSSPKTMLSATITNTLLALQYILQELSFEWSRLTLSGFHPTDDQNLKSSGFR